MTELAPDKLAYNSRQAAEASGYSWDVIRAAISAGDLRETFPVVNGTRLKRGVIRREDLQAWLDQGGTS